MKGLAVVWGTWGLANGVYLGFLVGSDFGSPLTITIHSLIVVVSVFMVRYCLRRAS